MGILSWLFGKKDESSIVRQRADQPAVIDIQNDDEKMNWAMEKARLTLHYFENCLKSPSQSQQYFSIKVKIEDAGLIEHLWLSDPNFDDDGNLFGIVGNEPIDVKNVAMDQSIGIDKTLVSDWMIIENGRLIGGYTIRVLRDKVKGKELINFDNQLGGMIIDEGEDYFLTSDDIPETAIIKIEEAFNEDNIEKALDCKDFHKEAELMLKKMGKLNLGDEMIDKTAELLKLSFVKSLLENGIPKFNGIKRAFPKREKLNDNHMIITEICIYPDGRKALQRINTFRNESGWKVLNPEN